MRRFCFSIVCSVAVVQAAVHVLVVGASDGDLTALLFDDAAKTLTKGPDVTGAGGPLDVTSDAQTVAALNSKDELGIFSINNVTGDLKQIGSPIATGKGAISVDFSPKQDAIAIATNSSNQILTFSFANNALGSSAASTQTPESSPSEVLFDLSSTYLFAPLPASYKVAQYMSSGEGALQSANPVSLPSQQAKVEPSFIGFSSGPMTRLFVANVGSKSIQAWSMCYGSDGSLAIASAFETLIAGSSSNSTAAGGNATSSASNSTTTNTTQPVSAATGPPCALEVTPDGKTLVVGTCSGSNDTIYIFSIAQDDSKTVLTSLGSFAAGAALSNLNVEPSAGQYVAATSASGGSVTIFSLTATGADQIATVSGLPGASAIRWVSATTPKTLDELAKGCTKTNGNLGNFLGSTGPSGSSDGNTSGAASLMLAGPCVFLGAISVFLGSY